MCVCVCVSQSCCDSVSLHNTRSRRRRMSSMCASHTRDRSLMVKNRYATRSKHDAHNILQRICASAALRHDTDAVNHIRLYAYATPTHPCKHTNTHACAGYQPQRVTHIRKHTRAHVDTNTHTHAISCCAGCVARRSQWRTFAFQQPRARVAPVSSHQLQTCAHAHTHLYHTARSHTYDQHSATIAQHLLHHRRHWQQYCCCCTCATVQLALA